jgi:hypothetical protein
MVRQLSAARSEADTGAPTGALCRSRLRSERAKPMKTYRMEYPVTIMFDVEAENATDARQKALAELAQFDGSFDNGFDAPFDEGRAYLQTGKEGVILARELHICDVVNVSEKFNSEARL